MKKWGADFGIPGFGDKNMWKSSAVGKEIQMMPSPAMQEMMHCVNRWSDLWKMEKGA